MVTAVILIVVNTVPQKPLLLGSRISSLWGWVQVILVVSYSGVLSWKMLDNRSRNRWREMSWVLFSLLFYAQLVLGVYADTLFLLTGKLHLPIPAMILAGPLYRFNSWFMIVLFLSTVMIAGPAWCSHLCYFGAIDSLAAGGEGARGKRGKIVNQLNRRRGAVKLTVLTSIIIAALALRAADSSSTVATTLGVCVGLIGIVVIVFISRKKGIMVNCTYYCPIGTIVTKLKYLSPFRFSITEGCTGCNACISVCKYGALTKSSIADKRVESTCTYCGDCISVCKHQSLRYSFFKASPSFSYNIWIAVTVILHSVFLAIARI